MSVDATSEPHHHRIVLQAGLPDVPEERGRRDQRGAGAGHEEAVHLRCSRDDKRDQHQDDAGHRQDEEARCNVDHSSASIVRQRRRRDRRTLRSCSSRRAQPFSIARAIPPMITSSHNHHQSIRALPSACRIVVATVLPSRADLNTGVGVGSGIGAIVAAMRSGQKGEGGRKTSALAWPGALAGHFFLSAKLRGEGSRCEDAGRSRPA